MASTPEKIVTLGWREWASLPDMGIARIKAKVDTGARTSSLHAYDIEASGDSKIVTFKVHPMQQDEDTVVECSAKIVDRRMVTNSGGQQEDRIVISTDLHIGDYHWPIEITLTARHDMKFRMLLGRTAFRGIAHVNPARSYLVGHKYR